jgi:hypothetical protein
MEEVINNEVVYGPTGDGEYVTKWQTTIIYHEDSVFETSVAFLAARAQIIPISSITDFAAVADSCEHPSPEVFIFGDEFSTDDLLTFFARGFQIIHIFTYNDNQAKKYQKELSTDEIVDTMNIIKATSDIVAGGSAEVHARDDNVTDAEGGVAETDGAPVETDGAPVETDVTMIPFDERTTTFTIDTLYEHIIILEGMMPMFALEHVICAEFPNYQSAIPKITHVDGRNLLRYLRAMKKSIGPTLLTLASSFRGFDEVSSMVIKGQAMFESREIMANQRIYDGVIFNVGGKATDGGKITDTETKEKPYTAIALYGGDLREEMRNLIPVHPTVVEKHVNFAVFWEHRMPESFDDYFGYAHDGEVVYRVIIVGIKDAPSALETLRGSCDKPEGSYGQASGFVLRGSRVLPW